MLIVLAVIVFVRKIIQNTTVLLATAHADILVSCSCYPVSLEMA
jgi:hypothetical protein